jgi:hypothetical protein
MYILVPTNQQNSPRCELIVGVRFGSCRVVEVIRRREIVRSDNDATRHAELYGLAQLGWEDRIIIGLTVCFLD